MYIRKHNEIYWDNEVNIDNKWTIPVSSMDIEMDRKGDYIILLTSIKLISKTGLEMCQENIYYILYLEEVTKIRYYQQLELM